MHSAAGYPFLPAQYLFVGELDEGDGVTFVVEHSFETPAGPSVRPPVG